ncbi:hypothetical protein OX283_013040 [Flavobacterium sp. SUN052]|uniref:hypothetical protein n=1 Tax=Flavobacterium sp. SUN052 TaxID=3002441 RepID=UPI00237E094C|nr:hypothetical protein [Flavobacterium sp. SUN052]MEC4005589.1 hypothetical protein [Flavobacterium sp. SUN052]
MKKQFHILIILVTFGFFLLPSVTYACGTKSQNECCKTVSSSKKENKDCCNSKHSNDKKNNSCGGKCGHSNCTTSSVSFSVIPFYEVQFKNNALDFFTEKSKFYHSETFITSGFTTVWLPPKIK